MEERDRDLTISLFMAYTHLHSAAESALEYCRENDPERAAELLCTALREAGECYDSSVDAYLRSFGADSSIIF